MKKVDRKTLPKLLNNIRDYIDAHLWDFSGVEGDAIRKAFEYYEFIIRTKKEK
jgi:hypothetical protein